MKNSKTYLKGKECQVLSIPTIRTEKGIHSGNNLPLLTQIRLFFRRHLDLEVRRKIKRILFLDRLWQPKQVKNRDAIDQVQILPARLDLQIGDRVRVRSREEILATLDEEGKLKGCSFIDVMWQYCGTTQKVFKPVHRFVDERNYQVRNVRGMVLLEGVMCDGTDFYGSCDRSCLFFWREEWLEKLAE